MNFPNFVTQFRAKSCLPALMPIWSKPCEYRPHRSTQTGKSPFQTGFELPSPCDFIPKHFHITVWLQISYMLNIGI
jgi:hypothetical protein